MDPTIKERLKNPCFVIFCDYILNIEYYILIIPILEYHFINVMRLRYIDIWFHGTVAKYYVKLVIQGNGAFFTREINVHILLHPSGH